MPIRVKFLFSSHPFRLTSRFGFLLGKRFEEIQKEKKQGEQIIEIAGRKE